MMLLPLTGKSSSGRNDPSKSQFVFPAPFAAPFDRWFIRCDWSAVLVQNFQWTIHWCKASFFVPLPDWTGGHRKRKSFFPIAFAENGRKRRLSEKIAQTQGKDKPTRSSVNRTMRFGSTRNALSGEIMTCKHSRRTTSINQNAGFGVRSGHGKRFGGSPSICTHSDVQTFEKRSEPSGLSLRLTERVLTL